MTQMIHGRRHLLEFYEPPTGNQWNDAIKEVLGIGHCYKCIQINEEKTEYIIEEVDIWKSLEKNTIQPSEYTRTVSVKLTCMNCKHVYNIWCVMSRRDSDQRTYYYHTEFCPLCPPISVDAWLVEQGYSLEEPAPTATPERGKQTTITAEELDKFE